MSTATEKKPPRKFPPPCWTQDEALALIEAYRERWYALRRGYLRTADWDAVAVTVGQRFPGVSPPKTSAQCRHKMEKLRQRYRAEKQRSSLSTYPGRFLSSWFFFDSMDAMEHGSPSTVGSIDENLQNSAPIEFRSSNSKPRVSNVDNQYLNFGSDEDGDDGNNLIFRGNRSGKFYRFSKPKLDSNHGEDYDGVDSNVRCSLNTQIDQDFGSRAKKLGKFGGEMKTNFDWDDRSRNRVDANGDFWVKVSGDRNSVPLGVRGKYGGKRDVNLNPNFDPRVPNGNTSFPVFGSGGRGGRVKRGRSPVAEMVSSIKMLGEGFVKMEKMKLEMAKEIEKMRMEMEMKRNELLLESQQQIVDAFVKGLFDGNKKVKNSAVSPDS